MIRVPASAFVTDTHSELQFFLPEGYGQGDVVTVFVGGQVNKETITFDYSIPTVTKVTPYCGQGTWFISYVIMVLHTDGDQGDPLLRLRYMVYIICYHGFV